MLENVVLSNTKMEIIKVALKNLVFKQIKNPTNCKKLMRRLDNQMVKSFGDFKFSLEDSADISIATRELWDLHRNQMLADNSQAGYIIRKQTQAILDEFSGIYMNLDSDVKDGQKFRDAIYLSRLDMNC